MPILAEREVQARKTLPNLLNQFRVRHALHDHRDAARMVFVFLGCSFSVEHAGEPPGVAAIVALNRHKQFADFRQAARSSFRVSDR